MIDPAKGYDAELVNEIILASQAFTQNNHFYNPSPDAKLAAYGAIRAAQIEAEARKEEN